METENKTIAIHCETNDEFNRILDYYKVSEKSRELLYWSYYKKYTVFYPELDGDHFLFGDINGHCRENNIKVVSSLTIQS